MNIHLRTIFRTKSSLKKQRKYAYSAVLGFMILLLAACDSGSGATPTTTPTVAVNGFGGANNHGHSLVALPNNVLMLATHAGLFRSGDNGTSWHEVAGGVNQPMDGLMTTSLVSSTVDKQRLYVITQPSAQNAKGTLGLYTSADEGQTWQLASATKTLGNMYFVAAGNDSPEETYTYILTEGPQGLKVSHDAGQHFTNTGTLPFSILGLLALPGEPGQLLVYGDNGIARSSDSGAHWQVLAGTTGGVSSMTTSGPHSPIYASGDAGIYASNDGGKTFKLVYTQTSFGTLIASPVQANTLYTKTGLAVYRSTDGGRSWTTLPTIQGNHQNPGDMAPDLHNPGLFYLSISYPMQLYRFDQSNTQWTSLTPKA